MQLSRITTPLAVVLSTVTLLLVPSASAQIGTGFVENRGQWPEEVLFMTRLPGQTVWVTREALVYDFSQVEPEAVGGGEGDPLSRRGRERREREDRRVRGHVVELRFDGGTMPDVRPGAALGTRFNYFLGNDPARHASNVPVYEEVTLEGLYDGVDLRVGAEAGTLALTFEADDTARLELVRLAPREGEAMIKEGDAVMVMTSLGSRTLGEVWGSVRSGAVPQGYAAFISMGGTRMDLDRPVYEQPERLSASPRSAGDGLIYSTLLGGSIDDVATTVVVDSDGAVTVAGWTSSANFPSTPGAYDETYNGDYDAFVARLNASGSALLFATFLGGAKAYDEAYSVALGPDGSVIVAGVTLSEDFPTTPGAYDETYNGNAGPNNSDAFVARLNASGSSLLFATFLGGSEGSEDAWSLIVGPDGSATVAGLTSSADFPTTPGAFDEMFDGSHDAFVARLNASGSALLFATFLGGSDEDGVRSVVLGLDGSVVVAGWTSSADFPTTPGAFDETFDGGNGDSDGFVARLNASGSALLFATFLGGAEGSESAWSLVVGPDGSVVVAGVTSSADFPTTPGAFDRTHNGHLDGFVARLNADGSSLLYATFLGGTDDDLVSSTSLRPDGSVIATGETYSPSKDFPTTPGAYDETYNGRTDAFVVHLDVQSGGPQAPDLIVSGLVASPDQAPPGAEVSVSFAMQNVGDEPSAPSLTNLRLSTSPTEVTPADPLLAEVSVPAVQPGTFLEFQEDVVIPAGLGPGTYYLWAIADVNGTAGQTPEGEMNDKVNISFEVTEQEESAPDLAVAGLKVSPTEGPPGAEVSVFFAMQNIGDEPSAPSQTNLRLGTSPTEVTTDDPLLAEIAVPAIAPGASLDYQEVVTVPVDLPPGSYYLWAIADVNGTAGQTPDGELNDKVNIPFEVTGGTASAFVYKVEFNQAAQRRLANPFEDDPVDLIPGKDLVVRYYMFGDSGPIASYSTPLIFTTRVGGETITRSIERNDGQETSDIPADPGEQGTARDEALLAQRVPPPEGEPYISLNYVVRGDWLLDAESATFVLRDKGQEIAQATFNDLQENRADLVVHLYIVDSDITNSCTPEDEQGGLCPAPPSGAGDGPLTEYEVSERLMAFLRAALPIGEVHVKVKSFTWDGGRTDENTAACGELVRDLKAETIGEPSFIIPDAPFWRVNLAAVRSFPPHMRNGVSRVCRGQSSGIGDASDPYWRNGDSYASSVGLGEVAAHEISHTIGLLHAGNSHGDEGKGGENWPYTHGLMGASTDFGVISKPVDGYPTEDNPGDWIIRVVDPCPEMPLEDRNPCILGDGSESPPHELMSYGSSEYSLGPLDQAAASHRWTSPLNYGRIYRAIRDSIRIIPFEERSLVAVDPPASRRLSTYQGSPTVPALIVSGMLRPDGTGFFSPLVNRSVPEHVLTSGIDSGYRLELYGQDGEILLSEEIEMTEPTDLGTGELHFVAAFPHVSGIDRILLLEGGSELLEATASQSEPTIQVLSPNGGEEYAVTDSVDVVWEATDADGDPLRTTVQYSIDGGANWESVAIVGSETSSISIPAEQIGMDTEGLIRVSTSDGLRTNEDVSDAPFFIGKTGTGVDDQTIPPLQFTLGQPVPNPSTSQVRLPLSLPEMAKVRIALYDLLGRQVAIIADGRYRAGSHVVDFDVSTLASGVYIARGVLEADNREPIISIRRITIVR